MCEVGLENWEILPLLTRTCSKKPIYEVEKNWVWVLRADLNTNLPIREEATMKDYRANYYKNNKEAIRQCQAAYYENNKEVVRQQETKYRENNKDAIKKFNI